MKERIRESPMGEKPQEELELSSLEEQLAKTREQLLVYATDLARTFAADQRKKRELEEEHKRLTALYEVSRTLNSVLDLEGVLSLAMDVVLEVTGAERAGLDEHLDLRAPLLRGDGGAGDAGECELEQHDSASSAILLWESLAVPARVGASRWGDRPGYQQI